MRLFVVILSGVIFIGCGDQKTGEKKSGVAAHGDAPDKTQADVPLELLDYAGFEKRIASHAGKIVVVDVWNTSCIPCMEAFPRLVALHERYGPERVACVSLSVDYIGGANDSPEKYREKVQAFLNRQRATFDNILATEESDTMMTKLDIDAPPAILVYDRQGTLRETFGEYDDEGNEFDTSIYDRVGVLVAQLADEK